MLLIIGVAMSSLFTRQVKISATVKLILLLIHLKLKSASNICHEDVEDYVYGVEE